MELVHAGGLKGSDNDVKNAQKEHQEMVPLAGDELVNQELGLCRASQRVLPLVHDIEGTNRCALLTQGRDPIQWEIR